MTLNDAIRYADMITAGRTPAAEYFEEQRTYAAMCADALRLMKERLMEVRLTPEDITEVQVCR